MRRLALLLAALLVLVGCGSGSVRTETVTVTVTVVSAVAPVTSAAEPAASQEKAVSGVPSYALDVLAMIDETGEPPPGFVGGRRFENRERLLPERSEGGARVRYREYDVHEDDPDTSRGPERLVVGDDRSAYYTDDHYDSFTRIR